MQPPYPYAPPQAASPPKKTPVWLIVLLVVGAGGIIVVGTLVTLAIYGTRRYIPAAKVAEAKNTVGAIARSARAAYERESLLDEGTVAPHAFCKSAIAVPASVPRGIKYAPSSTDFDTGDEHTGWRCLKFSMSMPFYYQYSYQQGSGYLAPATSPGPAGFEAAARGDIDGDGDTSLFSVTGGVSGGMVTSTTAIHIENEFE